MAREIHNEPDALEDVVLCFLFSMRSTFMLLPLAFKSFILLLPWLHLRYLWVTLHINIQQFTLTLSFTPGISWLVTHPSHPHCLHIQLNVRSSLFQLICFTALLPQRCSLLCLLYIFCSAVTLFKSSIKWSFALHVSASPRSLFLGPPLTTNHDFTKPWIGSSQGQIFYYYAGAVGLCQRKKR